MNNILNPTMRKTITKTVCIDSLFRTNLETDPSNFMFSLAEPINNVISMKLSSLELPNNWYTFSSRNQSNVFTIRCYNVPDPTLDDPFQTYNQEHIITIPEGNYLNTSFVPMFQSYLRNEGNGLEYIKFNINDFSAKTEFSAGLVGSLVAPYDPYVSNTDFYFELDFAIPGKPQYKTFGWAMGFQKPFYTVKYLGIDNFHQDLFKTNPEICGSFIASESSFGSSFGPYVFIEVDDFQRNVSSNTIVSYNGNGDSYLNNNILAKVVVSSGQFTNIIDNAGDFVFKKRNYFGPIKLEKMHIKLLNRFGEPVDNNWNDYAFSLELEVIYS
jgi:hypothetical protein